MIAAKKKGMTLAEYRKWKKEKEKNQKNNK